MKNSVESQEATLKRSSAIIRAFNAYKKRLESRIIGLLQSGSYGPGETRERVRVGTQKPAAPKRKSAGGFVKAKHADMSLKARANEGYPDDAVMVPRDQTQLVVKKTGKSFSKDGQANLAIQFKRQDEEMKSSVQQQESAVEPFIPHS